MNDAELVRKVLTVFSADIPQRIRLLKMSLDQRDERATREALHSLKGAAANVSANAVQSLLNELEHVQNAGGLDPVVLLMPELERQLDLFEICLKQRLI